MKAIHHSVLLQTLKFFGVLAVGGFGLSSNALAHHDSNTLELYPRDVADACIPGSLQIRVTINEISHVGLMKLELYAEEKGFLEKKGRLRVIRVPAEDAPQLICINVPAPGSYAIAGYHDKDADRKLDKKWNFTPKEPYGLSNNPEFEALRMPKFSEAEFDVPANGRDIIINLVDLKKKSKDKDDD